MQGSTCPYRLSKYALLVFTLIATLLLGCSKKHNTSDANIRQQILSADSLYFNNSTPAAKHQLTKLRAKLSFTTPAISLYYYLMATHYNTRADQINLYADSALMFFKDPQNADLYPEDYLHALMAKGDACLHLKKYAIALDYYYKAKKTLAKTGCDNGDVASKMGVIYYGQHNYKQAARYWVESYSKLESCNKKVTPQELFFSKQSTLDNIAICYEQAYMPDSARYYYQLDLKLINSSDSSKTINADQINAARIVLYDNLGGLNLKQGNLTEAARYLNLCLAIPYNDRDGARIPPLVKLAELEIKLGNYEKASDAFKKSKVLLKRFMADNLVSEMKWNRMYAIYLTKLGQQDSAYYYLNTYITRKRFIDSSSTELYRLNIEREIESLQQQQSLVTMAQQDSVKKLYIEGFGIIALLSLFIIYLIYRNLKKTKKNHQKTTLQNQQLQQTLAELELVNQNYIRIMRVMAHDLRNPLSGMVGMAAVLLTEDEFSAENRHMLQLIESTGMHSMEMINALLKTGLADENEQEVTTAIDLRSLLYDSVELLQFKASEKGQQIIFEGDDVPVIVNANHEKLWRVFNNLIVNAIKFSYEAGIIKVAIKTENGCAVISISDNGIGIPPGQKDSVFEMFTPAKKAGTHGEQPFGLGLSISKRIIEKHRGKIWFVSNAGAGTTFYIALPL